MEVISIFQEYRLWVQRWEGNLPPNSRLALFAPSWAISSRTHMEDVVVEVMVVVVSPQICAKECYY
jgi:hypothetical protein